MLLQIIEFIKNDKTQKAFGKESWKEQDLTPNTDDKTAIDW